MLQRRIKGARNRLDLNDRVQVRIIRKRLKVSDRQLGNLVQTVGNSIAAITKEANARKDAAAASEVPSAVVIASVENTEAAADEASLAAAVSQPA
ncbi:MAG TPA: DUF3606 domain-containing protein [Bradyrhizobium sp.]|uniref:DUF3606 domain-containing protein n=1 Tax=Bradyrhizobium sp. TaxID=376 RepID=UPI002D7F60CC|nr:DUF3606 domain-containing protein [Bradyrhizobium sp.]HET7884790.1 DUF3606 domain-containing protein [Bradyrhizobium sp.]